MTDSFEGHLHQKCGGRYARASETVTIRLSGMQATVDREIYRCSKCCDEQRTVEQREAAELEAHERIRSAHTLLAPREIRHLREGLGLTAQQLGELLYGTPKGVVEGWERGRYLQNRDTDAILRGFSDRATVEQRAARAGVLLRSPDELERDRAERSAALSAARSRGKGDLTTDASSTSGNDVPNESKAASPAPGEFDDEAPRDATVSPRKPRRISVQDAERPVPTTREPSAGSDETASVSATRHVADAGA